MPTTYYVSNGASNGYTLGVDANNGTSKATPKLTINAAHALAAAGDTIFVNATTTTYVENVSGASINFNKALTVQGDGGNFFLNGPTGQNTCAGINGAVTVVNCTLDLNGESGKNGFGIFVTGATFLTCSGKNFIANAGLFRPAVANITATIDTPTFRAADNNATGSLMILMASTGMTVNLKAPTLLGTGFCQMANTLTNVLTVTANAGGTRGNIQPFANLFVLNTNNAAVSFDRCDFVLVGYGWSLGASTSIQSISVTNCTGSQGGTNQRFISVSSSFPGNIVLTDNVFTAAGTGNTLLNLATFGATVSGTVSILRNTITNMPIAINVPCASGEIANNTISCTAIANDPIVLASRSINNFLIHDNTITGSGISANNVINAGIAGSGLKIYNNVIATDALVHNIIVGSDGYQRLVSNSGGTTSLQNIGDTINTMAVAQIFTTPADSYGFFATLGAIRPYIQKVGVPTGTVTVNIYSDSAGSPGALVASTAYTLAGAILPSAGSLFWTEFWSEARYALMPATNYHMVILVSGSADAANYYQLQKNTAGTALKTSTSAISVWTTGSGTLFYDVQSLVFEIASPQVYGNKLTYTGASVSTNHGILIGAVNGAIAYGNQCYNTTIALIFKVADGSVNPLVAYDNLAFHNLATSLPMLYDKGSKQAQFFNNEMVSGPTSLSAPFGITTDTPNVLSGVAVTGTPSRSVKAKNNIFVQQNSNSGAFLFLVGYLGATLYDYSVITPSVDNNLFFTASTVFSIAKLGQGSEAIGTSYANLAAHRTGTSLDSKSVSANPVLAATIPAAPADFVPSSAGPARGIGTNSNGQAATDYNGVAFAFIPSAGAFSIEKTYAGSGQRALTINPVTGQLDLVGPTAAYLAASFAPVRTLVSITASVTIPAGAGEYDLLVDATAAQVDVTLPAAALASGLRVFAKKTDASGNAVRFVATIDGTSNYSLASQLKYATVDGNGASFYVVGNN